MIPYFAETGSDWVTIKVKNLIILHSRRLHFLKSLRAHVEKGRERMPRYTLRRISNRVYLWGFAVVIIGLLLTAAGTLYVTNNIARAHAQQEIDEVFENCDYALSQNMDDLLQLSTWITSQGTLGELTQARNGPALNEYLTPLIQADLVDAIAVVDAQGKVLTRLRVEGPERNGDYLAAHLGVTKSLAGVASTEIESDLFGHLAIERSIPVYSDGQSKLVGVVIMGLYWDTKLVRFWSDDRDIAYVVSSENKIALSSLDEIEGKPSRNAVLPAQVAQAEQQGTKTDPLVLATGKGNYLFQFAPLRSPNHSLIGMLGIGIAEKYVDKELMALWEPFALGLVASLLGMGLAALCFSRAFVAPMQSLNSAVRKMALGDLSAPITSATEDEMGELAHNLDEMRRRLKQTIESSDSLSNEQADVFQAMQVAIIVTDHENRIKLANRCSELLLGEEQAILMGQHWSQVFLMDADSDEAVPSTWDPGRPGPLVIRGRSHLRSRPEVVLDVVSVSIKTHTHPALFVHTLCDVSAAEKLSQSKEDLVLNIAHELRSPLASLAFSIDLLTEDYATLSKQEIGVMLRTMQKVSRRFQGLVENLLDVGNIQTGRFRVRPALTSVEKLIRNATEQTQSLWEAKGQYLECRLQAETAMVMADPSRITQVLVNLLTNANKYGPEDRPVVLSTWREAGSVYIGVTDQGVGIPPEEQSRVFERFFRAKRVEEEGAGIGIGLALAKTIVEAQGGQIHVRSDRDDGTTFWFSLPETRTAQQPVLPSTAEILRGSYENSVSR